MFCPLVGVTLLVELTCTLRVGPNCCTACPRAKQYLPFFQRAGKMQAVVEYVLSGHRLKVRVVVEQLAPAEELVGVVERSGVTAPTGACG